MTLRKKVILLNGPSSSGKSTLAAALRKLIEDKRNEDYGVVSIDDFLKLRAGEAVYEDDVFEIAPQICTRAIRLLETRQGVIIDHVMTSERIFNQLLEALGAWDLLLIRVTCPPAELARRERARKDRCPGTAEASDRYLFPKDGYDLTVDTFLDTAQACSARILNLMG